MRPKIFLIIFMIIIGTTTYAQPNVTVVAEQKNNFHSVLFTFTQADVPSMEGCHYNLFAADKASDLQALPGKGISIATFFKPLAVVQIIADPLPHLSRLYGKRNPHIQKRARVYFRTLLSCPLAQNGIGELISISMKTFPRGKLLNTNQLTYSMKYHMQYYNPA